MQTADQVAQKWAKNLGMATTAIQNGVMSVQTSPMTKAAANQAGWIAGVQQAAANGKWVRGLNRKTLQDWQNAMTTKGIQRIGAGAQAAIPSMTSFMQQWLPYEQQLQQKLSATPRGDLQTNIQRAVTAMQFNAAFVRQ